MLLCYLVKRFVTCASDILWGGQNMERVIEMRSLGVVGQENKGSQNMSWGTY